MNLVAPESGTRTRNRVVGRPGVRGGFLSVLMAGILMVVCTGVPVGAEIDQQQLDRLAEAMAIIQERALQPPPSGQAMVEDILRAYSHQIDPWGDFLTRREYQAFQRSSSGDYFGVEMDIEKQEGRIFLYPFPGGLAERRGIRAGDELVAVNGRPVFGQSVYVIGSAIRGAEGQTVQLTVRQQGGIPRIFSLRREKTTYTSVRTRRLPGLDYVRISRFVRDTPADLLAFLTRSIGAETPLIIDLRGNQGGNLKAAEQCADFFLPVDAPLVTVQGRRSRVRVSATLPMATERPLVLLQDRLTASAAEVFIAALEDNRRSVSVGQTTYGKGLAQRFFFLQDGSALRLTFAELITPGGRRFNRKGLEPDHRYAWPETTDDEKGISELVEQVQSVIDSPQN